MTVEEVATLRRRGLRRHPRLPRRLLRHQRPAHVRLPRDVAPARPRTAAAPGQRARRGAALRRSPRALRSPRSPVEKSRDHLLLARVPSYATALVFFVYYFFTRRESQNPYRRRVRRGRFRAADGGDRAARLAHRPRPGGRHLRVAADDLVGDDGGLLPALGVAHPHQGALGLYVMPLVLVFLGIGVGRRPLGVAAPAAGAPKSHSAIIHAIAIFTAVGRLFVAQGLRYLLPHRRTASSRAITGLTRAGPPAVAAGPLDRLFHPPRDQRPALDTGASSPGCESLAPSPSRSRPWYGRPAGAALRLGHRIVYAALLRALRHFAGWRGRRTAYLALPPSSAC